MRKPLSNEMQDYIVWKHGLMHVTSEGPMCQHLLSIVSGQAVDIFVMPTAVEVPAL